VSDAAPPTERVPAAATPASAAAPPPPGAATPAPSTSAPSTSAPSTPRPPSRRRRALVALAVGVLSALYVVVRLAVRRGAAASDVDQIWASSQALLRHLDPYSLAVIGPGSRFYDYPFPFFYPFTATVAGLLLTPLPMAAAGPAFALASGATLAWVLTRDGFDRLPVLLSGAYLGTLLSVQLSPLMTAAALVPALGWALAIKPNIGLAMWSYRASLRSAAFALLLVVVSLAVRPDWVPAWLASVHRSQHFRAPVQHAGGFLVLLALLRWRRPEARLLVALACVPHTTLAYETLPLALVPRSRVEAMVYAVLTWPVLLGQLWLSNQARGFAVQTDITGDLALALVYLPCVIMVLRRPNEGALPPWVGRLWRRARGRVAPGRSTRSVAVD
jgi:hypothetical protein